MTFNKIPLPPLSFVTPSIKFNSTMSVHKQSKYEKDGEYFLVINLSNQRPNNGEDPGGEILADAKVNKSIYDSKKIGDEFCFEN